VSSERSYRDSRTAGRGDPIDRLLMAIARLAGVVLFLALAYLLYVLFSPVGFLDRAGQFTPHQQALIAQRVHWACQGLSVGVLVLIGALVFRARAIPEVGYLHAVVGALLLWGGPALVEAVLGGSLPAPGSPAGRTAALIVRTFQALGAICLAAGGVYALLDVVERLRPRRARERTKRAILTSPRRVREMAEQEEPRNVFLGRCWNLPYCRPALRPHCPIYQRGSKPCWRIGVGCMCSEEVLLIAARNEGIDVKPSSGSRTRELFVLPTIDEMAKRLTPRQKSERCGKCVIYLYHQEQKYRASVWIAASLVTAALFLWRPLWHQLFVTGATAADRVARIVALPMPTRPEEQHPALQNWVGRLAESSAVEWIVLFCAALLVLTYLLRALEFAIYRMRL
jgi:hypothetical protein